MLLLLPLLAGGCGEGFANAPLQRAEVRGRVVGGDPAQTTVSVLPGDSTDPAAVLLSTGVDAEGRFVLQDVPATRVTLHIVGSPTQALFLPVDVAGAQVTDVGDVVLPSAASLRVLVRDSTGRPLPGAEVDLEFSPFGRQTTDSQGIALFSPLAPACYRVRARAQGFAEAEVERCIAAGEAAEVDLTLQPD